MFWNERWKPLRTFLDFKIWPPKRTKKKCPKSLGHALTIFQVKFQNFHCTVSCVILWSLYFSKRFRSFWKLHRLPYSKVLRFYCRPVIPVKAYLWLPIFVIFRNINSFSVISKSSLFGCSWCWVVLPGVTCRSLFKNLASYVTEVIWSHLRSSWNFRWKLNPRCSEMLQRISEFSTIWKI